MVRALTSHQSDLGSNPGVNTICMWVEFVVGSLPFSERFSSGYSYFPLSSKNNIFKFQFNQDQVDEEPPCECVPPNRYFIYLVSLSELSSPADRLLFTWQGFFANCCQLLKICTTGMLLI